MDEREVFEAWATTYDLDLMPGFEDQYSDCNTDFAWLSWKACRSTMPDSEFEFTDGVSTYTVHGDKKTIDALSRWKTGQQRITENALSGWDAVIEECAKVCDARYMGDNNREDMEAKRCAEAIRALKTAPATDKGGA